MQASFLIYRPHHLKWSLIYDFLDDLDCDVLSILDCCKSGGAGALVSPPPPNSGGGKSRVSGLQTL